MTTNDGLPEGYVHPKDRDLPGFTHDSAGRPKRPPRRDLTREDVDPGLLSMWGTAFYGAARWREMQRIARRKRGWQNAVAGVVVALLVSLALLVGVAAVLGLLILVSRLWSAL